MDGQSGETKTSGIFKAMHAVMKEVGAIGKDRTNPAQNYKFRGIDDVLAVLQPLFVKHGIICTPEVLTEERELLTTKNGGSMASVRLKVKHTYEAADGTTKVATTYGEAMDSGDKAGNKAMSAALKYAHTESFSIPTYESDRDTEEASPEIAQRAPGVTEKTSPVAQPHSESGRASTFKAPSAAPRAAPKAQSGATFPNYGRAKGMPVAGASKENLEWYRSGCLRSLADVNKERWHDQERQLLAAIEDELSRHGGQKREAGNDEPPPPGDEDAPF